jgi:hypothetical protein
MERSTSSYIENKKLVSNKCNEICIMIFPCGCASYYYYYLLFLTYLLQLSFHFMAVVFTLVIRIVLMHWSLHIHPEHWQHSHSAGQIELTWVQNGPVVFRKAHLTENNNILGA